MRHFHVIRWNPVALATGERISVPDVDYASVRGSVEARQLAAIAALAGERTATYECDDACCTLHAPREITAAVAVA